MFKHHDLQMFGLKLNNYDLRLIFTWALKVVSRGSETQLLVGENLNYLIPGILVKYIMFILFNVTLSIYKTGNFHSRQESIHTSRLMKPKTTRVLPK